MKSEDVVYSNASHVIVEGTIWWRLQLSRWKSVLHLRAWFSVLRLERILELVFGLWREIGNFLVQSPFFRLDACTAPAGFHN